MSRELARLTEWAWTNGKLKGDDALLEFSVHYHEYLKHKYSQKSFGDSLGAVKSIFNDVCHYLRLLSYGGQGPETRHPKRIERINTDNTVVEFCNFLKAA